MISRCALCGERWLEFSPGLAVEAASFFTESDKFSKGQDLVALQKYKKRAANQRIRPRPCKCCLKVKPKERSLPQLERSILAVE